MQNHMLFRQNQSGVTLVELMIVLAIVGLLSGVGIPAYRSFIVSNKVEGVASTLHVALVHARSEARNRGVLVSICKSSNADSNNPTCNGDASANGSNTGWGSGWIIFVNRNNNNQRDMDEVLVKVQGQLIDKPESGSIVTNNGEIVSFNATGQATTVVNFIINAPSGSSNSSKAICISPGGRASIGKPPSCS